MVGKALNEMTMRRKELSYILLAVILLLGLYLRLSNLGTVQRFGGDQGKYYMEIMDWFQKGRWPLLGPWRCVGGDRAIGPGWFYTIAPALALSGFHPVAGAATIAVVGMLAIFLSWFWVLRVTGSQAAALAVAAIFSFSYQWVAADRVLWNPHMLPFAVVALACLIEGIPRRPVPCLALILMLTAILPHWHTSGIPVIMAAFPFVILATIRARGSLKEASRRAVLLWGLALLALLVTLYLPPIIYEFGPYPSNLRHYLANSFIPTPPSLDPIGVRAVGTTDRLIRCVMEKTFYSSSLTRGWPAWIAASVLVLLFLATYGRTWFKSWRTVELSPAYLVLLLGGFWLQLFLKGANVLDYFLQPVMTAPVLLAGWTAGRLLTDRDPRAVGSPWARSGGALIIAAGLLLMAAQLPRAWAVPHGRVGYGQTYKNSREIARYIVADTGAKPFSLRLIDEYRHPTMHLQYLVRWLGHPAENPIINHLRPIPRKFLGDQLYVVVQGKLRKEPKFAGPTIPLDPPVKIKDSWIYRIPAARLPPNFQAVEIQVQDGRWIIKIITS